MPFTPFHFGPHAAAALPLHRYIDVPVFIGANIVIDIEPALVMLFHLKYPLHGYCHTLLIGGLIGLLFGCAAYPFRPAIKRGMSRLRLPYFPTLTKMAVSGMLGAWLHILFDALIYGEIEPFYPFSSANPFHGLVSDTTLYVICALFFLAAAAIYFYLTGNKDAADDIGKL